ncbi:MAG: tripartite tricarboxylate transporter TctB family protein [Clostridia bacterium]|nr:tripartite tricarboxylate transporter TctB family protein [Clostridia bacterium]
MSKKQLILELFMPVVFIAMAVVFIVQAIPMGSEGTFPLMCGILQAAVAVYLIGKILVKREVVLKTDGLNVKKAALTVVALILYVLVLDKIGYCLSTFLLVAFIIWFLGYRNYKIILLCAALTAAATYVIFGVLLNVPLPMLIFE